MMKRKFLSLFVVVLAAIAAQNVDAVLMDFNDLPLGSVGNSFITSGIHVQVENFYPVAGGQISGTASVDKFMYAGGMGQELTLNGVDLKFNFNSCPACGIALLFHELTQGGINLGINNDVRKAANFADLQGTIGGAQVYVAGPPLDYGIILITGGNIQSFTIGGQALSIDSVLVCGSIVPEPATIVLLGLGGVSVLLFRKKA